MRSAYRQVPVTDTNLACNVVMLMDPDANVVRYFILYAQPFGAAHAVSNFYRVAEWLVRVARRYFHLAVEHFYDDFFLVDTESSAPLAQLCLQELFHLGFALDPQKSQPPSANAVVLGVHFDLQFIAQGLLQVRAKPDRIAQLTYEMQSVLDRGTLSPSHTAKLVGKCDFVNSTLFGR
eukprot:3911328-Amphidinium_carterae.1